MSSCDGVAARLKVGEECVWGGWEGGVWGRGIVGARPKQRWLPSIKSGDDDAVVFV